MFEGLGMLGPQLVGTLQAKYNSTKYAKENDFFLKFNGVFQSPNFKGIKIKATKMKTS